MVQGSLLWLRSSSVINPAHNPYRITQSRRENRGPAPTTLRICGSTTLRSKSSDYLCYADEFNAKAKSFHVAVWGNFPAACDFAEPDTYTTTRRRAVGNWS